MTRFHEEHTMPPALALRHSVCASLVVALLVSVGCARKRKTVHGPAEEPAPQAVVTVSPPPPAPSKAEAKPGLLARLNLLRRRKAKPPEPEPPPSAQEEAPQAGPRVKRERGVLARLFGRRPKALPKASSEDVLGRTATSAKGEVSPPPFEHNGLKLSIGETTKARIIATFGKPEHTFFSEGAEEILIYRRIRKIDSLYIFLDSQGLVKDYIITKEP
ncbi:MAG: hypothetical protein ACE5KY_04335 [Candidatus Tectimicrobiota bacterium]